MADRRIHVILDRDTDRCLRAIAEEANEPESVVVRRLIRDAHKAALPAQRYITGLSPDASPEEIARAVAALGPAAR